MKQTVRYAIMTLLLLFWLALRAALVGESDAPKKESMVFVKGEIGIAENRL